MELQDALALLADNDNYRVLQRIEENFSSSECGVSDNIYKAAIIDLETMGLDATQDEIIEFGMLCFSFDNQARIYSVDETYNALQAPSKPIPDEITRITGITDKDVEGQAIDWGYVEKVLANKHLIICHNSQFDRQFLEAQTNPSIQKQMTQKPFGCSLKDVDWKMLGFESSKLDYLNWKLGFFYDGHRAINDCWATFNLFQYKPESLYQLLSKIGRKEHLIVAKNAAFEKKDALKLRGYRWSDGTKSLPKGWHITVDDSAFDEEKTWLAEAIYGHMASVKSLPHLEITALNRYSKRAERI